MRDTIYPLLGKHWRRFIPEALLLLAGLIAVDRMLFAGDQFASLTPHPFWLPVLIAATQYGVAAGMFAAAAASVALYAGGLPAQAAGMDYYDYAASVTAKPALWFAAALLLGGLRAVQIRRVERTEERLAETNDYAETIAAAFTQSRAEIERLETRIASDTATTDGLLRRLAQLDLNDEAACAPILNGLAAEMIGASHVTIFVGSPMAVRPLHASNHGLAAGHSMPTPSVSALAMLAQTRRGVDRTQPSADGTLPEGSPLLAPIIVQPGDRLLGAIAVTRHLEPDASSARTLHRAELVGRALGALLSGAEWARRPVEAPPIRRIAVAD